VAPGVVAGLIPYLLTGWRVVSPLPSWGPVRVVGGAVTVIAALFLVSAFARFVVEGFGTPAPIAPTQHLVVGGLYRYVRNPMYLAVIAAIVGQALLFGQLGLLAYGLVAALAMYGFARAYEEPYLADRFGAEYGEYRQAVPGWFPRFTPWRPDR
jgi:protein-S-isoprenylcysteine O-methyltransferase Ste14